MSSIIGRSNSKFLYKGKSLDRRDKQWGPLSCLQIDYREIIQPSGEFSLGKSTISCDAACACVFYGRFDLAPAKGVLAFSLYKRSMRVIVTENRQHQMVWENSRPSTYIWTSRGHPKYFRKSRGWIDAALPIIGGKISISINLYMRSSTTHIPDIELDFLLIAYAVPPFLSFVCHLIGERERERSFRIFATERR